MGWRAATAVLAAGYLAVLAVNRSLVEVRGPSMEPTLWPGDLLLTVPALRPPRPGQVVVVERMEDPGDAGHLVLKRVAAVEGDQVVVHGDDPGRSTDSRQWGPLPRRAVRRVAVARWPDLRTPLTRPAPTPAFPNQPALRATSRISGSSSATSPSERRP